MLIFNELAWAKLLWFRDHCCEANYGEDSKSNSFDEVSLMGISAGEDGNKLIQIKNVICIPQEVSSGNTEIDDDSLADYFDMMREDHNISAKRCGRIWIHTHPGQSPVPSSVDHETYNKFFNAQDFNAMFIISQQDNYSCHVRYDSVCGMVSDPASRCFVVVGGEKYDMRDILTIHKKLEESKIPNKFLYNRYNKYHDAWLEEMKKNVKKKKYQYTQSYNTRYFNDTPHTYFPKTSYGPLVDHSGSSIRDSIDRQNKMRQDKNAIFDHFIKVIHKENINSIYTLSQGEMNVIGSKFGIKRDRVFELYRDFTRQEELVTVDDLKEFESTFDYDNLKQDDYLNAAQLIGVRVDKFIELLQTRKASKNVG